MVPRIRDRKQAILVCQRCLVEQSVSSEPLEGKEIVFPAAAATAGLIASDLSTRATMGTQARLQGPAKPLAETPTLQHTTLNLKRMNIDATTLDIQQPRAGLLERLLRIFGDVRAGEAATVLLLLTNIFLILAGYYICKTVREPLILASGGAEVKSYAAAGQALMLMFFLPL